MDPWKPTKRDLKQYPHFDAPLSLTEMERIANDPDEVAANKFYPFLVYQKSFTRFRSKRDEFGAKVKEKDKKTRDIRYGTRRDAAIFSRYRFGLSILYEKELKTRGLSDCVLAYRRIPVKPGSSSGKCNIHHAKSAFDYIKSLDNCFAIVMDISNYFENLDHSRIKNLWKRLLGVSELPRDHYAVFKAITQYSVVDLQDAYTALGFLGIVYLTNARLGTTSKKTGQRKELRDYG